MPSGPLDAGHIALVAPRRVMSSAFDVDGLLVDSAGFAVAAIDARGADLGLASPARSIDLEHLAAFCTTHVDVHGAPVPAWAELSGVYGTRDGRHVQIHCNFAHHAAGVVRRLGCSSSRVAVEASIAKRDAFELEAELIDDGMIGAAVRTLDEWDAHPHAAVTRDLPLVSIERLGDADPIAESATVPEHPLAGLRVLDCSRVLAGPTAGQMLAGFGADVLRIGAAHLPAVPVCVMATGFGKRNASLDLRTSDGAQRMDALLDDADVWIDAYRPGALAQLGFAPERVAERRPGIVMVEVSAFDSVGPWAGRRGFDSIVQSTTGVRAAGGHHAVDDDGVPLDGGPVGLPVQALDYATGFLAAGVAAHLVSHQRRFGGSWLARVSLLRTRNWLVGRREPHAFAPEQVMVDPRLLDDVDSDFGRLTTVRPFVGATTDPPRALGTSEPAWV